MVVVKRTIKNQLTLPKAVVELGISETDVAEAVIWARRQ